MSDGATGTRGSYIDDLASKAPSFDILIFASRMSGAVPLNPTPKHPWRVELVRSRAQLQEEVRAQGFGKPP